MAQITQPKSGGGRTILWWIAWIALSILSFFAASWFWTPVIYEKFGSVLQTRASIAWVTAVFGTWLVLLVPLIIIMYQKVDKAYEDARLRREKAASRFRSIDIPAQKRKIPDPATSSLKSAAETIEGGFLVQLTLNSGQKIPFAFVNRQNEIIGIYDSREMTFEGKDVVLAELAAPDQWPDFHATQWLRVDGVQPPD